MEATTMGTKDPVAAGGGKRRWARRVALAVLGVVLGYSGTCAALWAFQEHFIFEPETHLGASPADFPFPVYDVALPLPGGVSPHGALHGWWLPSDIPGARTVLYLHGTGGNVSTSVEDTAALRDLGYSVFLIDYRGYGESAGGFPSEAGAYADAEAAWDYLVQERGIEPGDLLVYGHSLGGAIAIELATHHPEAAGLVVESTFTSIVDMADLEPQYAVLPVHLLLHQRFDSVAKVGSLKLPVLYVHGAADETVPIAMGRRLYESTPTALGFISVPEGGHDDNAKRGGPELRKAIADFVARACVRAPGTPVRRAAI